MIVELLNVVELQHAKDGGRLTTGFIYSIGIRTGRDSAPDRPLEHKFQVPLFLEDTASRIQTRLTTNAFGVTPEYIL